MEKINFPKSNFPNTRKKTIKDEYFSFFTDVFAFHVFFKSPKKEVYCWGSNSMFELGIPDGKTKSEVILQPFFRNSREEIYKICCGNVHSVFLTMSGKLFACGTDNSGQLMQLGLSPLPDGSRKFKEVSELNVDYLDSPVVNIFCGCLCTFVLTSLGTTYAAGATVDSLGCDYDKLDDVSMEGRLREVNIQKGIVDIQSGLYHTLFLSNDGEVWGVGENLRGRLGLGSSLVLSKPTKYEFKCKQIACSEDHSLFLTDPDRYVYVTGTNEKGQIGMGDRLDENAPPIKHTALQNIVEISCYGDGSIFRTKENEILVCGDSSKGQCGLGTRSPVLKPTKNKFFDDKKVWFAKGMCMQIIVFTEDFRVYACGRTFYNHGPAQFFEMREIWKDFMLEMRKQYSHATGKKERFKYLGRKSDECQWALLSGLNIVLKDLLHD